MTNREVWKSSWFDFAFAKIKPTDPLILAKQAARRKRKWPDSSGMSLVKRGRCRHSLGVSDIDALGLLGFGGGIWIGRNWSKENIGVLDLLVLDDLVWCSITRFGFMVSRMYGWIDGSSKSSQRMCSMGLHMMLRILSKDYNICMYVFLMWERAQPRGIGVCLGK